MGSSDTQTVIINLISYIATVLAFAAVALLLYLVITELFMGRAKVFNFEETKAEKRRPSWFMPVICAASVWVLYLICVGFKNTVGSFVLFQQSTAGFFSMFERVTRVDAAAGWITTIVAVLFYTGTALLISKIDDEKTALLFCLNPVALFMVTPNTLSLIAFTVALAIYAWKKKNQLLLWLSVVAFILLHMPFKSTGPIPVISVEEAVMLVWAALLVLYSKRGKKFSGTAETISAIACGVVTAAFVILA